MKKRRFSILQQMIISVLFLALLVFIEGCLFIFLSIGVNLEDKALDANSLFSGWPSNPASVSYYEKVYKDTTDVMNTIISDCLNDEALNYFKLSDNENDIENLSHRIFDDNKSNFRIRILSNKNTLLYDNKDYVDYSLLEQKTENHKIKNFDLYKNCDDFFTGTDYYDSELYELSYLDGEEIRNALQNGSGRKNRACIENPYLLISYVAAPFYLHGHKKGIVLVSLPFSTRINDNAIYKLFRITLLLTIISVTAIVIFLFLRLTLPVRNLSRKTLEYAEKQGEIEFESLPYENRSNEIGDLSSSFSKLTRRLNKALVNMETYSSDVVHELKNPITAISMNAELLASEELSAEEYKKGANRIFKEARSLTALLSEMRENAKLENNLNSEADKENVNIDELLQNLVSVVKAKYEQTDFDFRTDGTEHILFAKCANLERLFVNLIDNAASFGEKVLVSVSMNSDSKKLSVSVEDSGPGVPVEEREKIFKRFYSSRKKNQSVEHSGLGLSNVKAIVDAISGTISVLESENLGGARFLVEIPL